MPIFDPASTRRPIDLPGFDHVEWVGSACIAHNQESTLIVTLMGRQDGRTSWSVTFVECDGNTKAITGLAPEGNILGPGINDGHDAAVIAINNAILILCPWAINTQISLKRGDWAKVVAALAACSASGGSSDTYQLMLRIAAGSGIDWESDEMLDAVVKLQSIAAAELRDDQ